MIFLIRKFWLVKNPPIIIIEENIVFTLIKMIPVFLVQKGGFLMRKTVLNMIAVIGVSVLCTISSFAATGGPGVAQISETEVSTEMVRKNPETMTAEEIIDDLYHNMGHTELIRCAKDNAALLTGEKAVVDNSGYMLIGIYNDASVMYDAAYPLGTEQQTIGVRSDGTYAALLSYTDYPTEAKQLYIWQIGSILI